MKILMFGWEFPPHNTGGLGTACYGLTKGLQSQDVQVTLVLPYVPEDTDAEFVKVISAGSIKRIGVNSPLMAYMDVRAYMRTLNRQKNPGVYGSDLFEEVERYAKEARKIASREDFDIIHAHDWLTFKAGMAAKHATGKPLVVHVHATEFDRTGGNGVNQYVYEIEREGMLRADRIIAVSNYTKSKIIERYGIGPEKIEVVHNAVEFDYPQKKEECKIKENEKVVLFLGRLTLQKGPDYFVSTAKKILDHDQNFKFIIAGGGDMEPAIIEKTAELGIGDKVLFAGFLHGEDVARAYKMADLYVMPSVSEPFGITPLEAIKSGTPCIISKQSGVSEVLHHCLKADFWDTEEMANKIMGILQYKEGYDCLKENAVKEVRTMTWDIPAQQCVDIYTDLVGDVPPW